MFEYNEELRELQRSLIRKKALETEEEDLRKKQMTMAPQVAALRTIAKREQKDVKRLEGTSVAALFYHATGKMEEKLATERREAVSALEQYESAARELESLESRIQEVAWELSDIDGCEERYKHLLKEKYDALKASGGPNGEKITGKERTLTFLNGQERQLLEAIAAGKAARTIADNVRSCLGSAAHWCTGDLLGGGILTDMTKREKLDEARTSVKQLQEKLSAFRTKLANASVRANLQLTVDGMLRYTDRFVETVLTELAELDRINRAKDQVEGMYSQIGELLLQLENTLAVTRQKREKTEASLEKMIVSMD